jgi:hypothetical protein
MSLPRLNVVFNPDDVDQAQSFLNYLPRAIYSVSLHISLTRFELCRPNGVNAIGAVQLFRSLATVCGSQLRQLDLTRCFTPLHDEDPWHVAVALATLIASAPSLDSLSFCRHGFVVGSLFGKHLFSAIAAHSTCLTHLDLCENYVRFAGVESGLDWLRANTTLRYLDLSDCLIDENAHVVIGAVARHPTLRCFRFAGLGRIDSVKQAAIVDFISNSPYTAELDLTNCLFSNAAEFVTVVDALRVCTRLRAISIGFGVQQYISGVFVDALVSLIDGNSTLRSLQLRGRLFESDAGRERFLAALVRNSTLLDVNESRFEKLPFNVMARNRCNLLRDIAFVLLAAPLPPYCVGEIVQYCTEFAKMTHAAIMHTICGVHTSVRTIMDRRRRHAE